MNEQKFTLISNIDADDIIEICIDLDTIDDDEPSIVLTNETLDTNGQELCPHSKKFITAWENDDLFLQCIWDIHDKEIGHTLDRGEYTIKVGGWNE